MFPRSLLILAVGLLAGAHGFSLSLLHYNVAGNGTTDWSTNSLQVQAIGRQMLYWQPEVVTFNEIPRTNTCQMANFVTLFLPANGQRPYLLSGDLNEDIAKPPSASGHPIERLISAPTGLRLTTPLNPVTASSNTFSIRSGPSERIDYILPCGLLVSNVATSQVFRTDALSPMPANLFTNDNKTASDHLPVIMSFRNPYDPAPRIASITASNQLLNLNWLTATGRTYRVEASTNFANWSAVSSNLLASTTNQSWSAPRNGPRQFFRVQRLP